MPQLLLGEMNGGVFSRTEAAIWICRMETANPEMALEKNYKKIRMNHTFYFLWRNKA